MSQKSGPASHTFDNDNSKWAKKQQQTKKTKKKNGNFQSFLPLTAHECQLVCLCARAICYYVSDLQYNRFSVSWQVAFSCFAFSCVVIVVIASNLASLMRLVAN